MTRPTPNSGGNFDDAGQFNPNHDEGGRFGSGSGGPVDYKTPDHPMVRDNGEWGSSHGNSMNISGHAADIMGGVEGWETRSGDAVHARTANKFLGAIATDTAGSEEALYHGFLNENFSDKYAVGDTLTLPLAATSGDIDSLSYGVRGGPGDQDMRLKGYTEEQIASTRERGGLDEHHPGASVFKFPEGTPMAAYGKWKIGDAKEFGHRYTEAIVSGKFKVTGVTRQRGMSGAWWDPEVEVITLEPVATFHPDSGKWKPTKTRRLNG